MTMPKRTFWVAALAIGTLPTTGCASARDVAMREIVSRPPNEIVFRYELSSPVKWVETAARPSADETQLDYLEIKFGNGKSANVPANILKCFRHPRAREAFLLIQEIDSRFPKGSDSWWLSLNIPYGPDSYSVTGSGSATMRSEHVYPYVEFQFQNWRLERIVLQKAPEEMHAIALPLSNCPADMSSSTQP